MVGFADLRGLFQPKQFHDSLISGQGLWRELRSVGCLQDTSDGIPLQLPAQRPACTQHSQVLSSPCLPFNLPPQRHLPCRELNSNFVMKQNPSPPPRERGSGYTCPERKERQMLQRERQRQALRCCLPVQGVTGGCDDGITRRALLQPQPGVTTLPLKRSGPALE